MTVILAYIVGAATIFLMVLFIALIMYIGELLNDQED